MSGLLSRIHIVDDDDITLWMFRELLQQLQAEVLSYASAHAFLASYYPFPSECLVCDLRMPELGGLQVQQHLQQAQRQVPIIFVSGQPDVRSAVEAMKCGAFDFLEKPVNGRLLLEKVQCALAHCRDLHAQQVAASTQLARRALLTPRELQIAERLVQGKSSSQIGHELAISTRTVENHRARLKDKLRISSTAELVRLFL